MVKKYKTIYLIYKAPVMRYASHPKIGTPYCAYQLVAMQYLLEGRLCNFWACVTELEPKLGLQGGGGEVPDKHIRELTEPIRGITVQTGTKLGEPLIQ